MTDLRRLLDEVNRNQEASLRKIEAKYLGLPDDEQPMGEYPALPEPTDG